MGNKSQSMGNKSQSMGNSQSCLEILLTSGQLQIKMWNRKNNVTWVEQSRLTPKISMVNDQTVAVAKESMGVKPLSHIVTIYLSFHSGCQGRISFRLNM